MAIDWPKDLIDGVAGLVEPEGDIGRDELARRLLDEVGGRIVWRARGRAEFVLGALNTPYTPWQDAINTLMYRDRLLRAIEVGFQAEEPLQRLKEHVAANADALCEQFGREMIPYNDRSAVED